MQDELRYQVLRFLSDHPQASQREVAQHLGMSVGKVNYCIQALVDKGLIRVNRFKNSRHKAAYLYLITPKGLEQKLLLTYRFLQRKMKEYDSLAVEIEALRAEVDSATGTDLVPPAEQESVPL